MRHNRLVQQFRNRETSECTFTPKTNNKRTKSAMKIEDEELPYVKLYHV
jgi:hypothetical protein